MPDAAVLMIVCACPCCCCWFFLFFLLALPALGEIFASSDMESRAFFVGESGPLMFESFDVRERFVVDELGEAK